MAVNLQLYTLCQKSSNPLPPTCVTSFNLRKKFATNIKKENDSFSFKERKLQNSFEKLNFAIQKKNLSTLLIIFYVKTSRDK